jgi:GNAT superfamily N-acetyltransferase
MKSEQHRLDCTIRAPQPSDFERMAELAEQLGYPCTPEKIERRLAVMKDGKQYAVYVAELAEGEIAGWIGTYVFRSVELDSFAEVNGLVVDKKVRSRGVGRLLLEAAERWSLSCGCDAVAVHSNVKRHHAHRFYEKNGYEWTKTQKSFRKTLTVRRDASCRLELEVTRLS